MLATRIAQPMRVLAHQYGRIAYRAPTRANSSHVDLRIDRGNYTVKVATSAEELTNVFRLRQKVFQREFKNRLFSLQPDRDTYDDHAEYLIIVDRGANDKVVGTYRLIASIFSERFYSASEFHLGRFLATPEPKLELSRACIHRRYRTGIVMSLLWRGVAQYAQAINARYLFGCGSVRITDVPTISRVYTSLENAGKVANPFGVVPHLDYEVPNLDLALDTCRRTLNGAAVEVPELPSLIRSYFKAGARVHGLPAIDWDFRCIDMLTILDFANISQGHERKYLK